MKAVPFLARWAEFTMPGPPRRYLKADAACLARGPGGATDGTH
jgi:hypothetical protein